MTSQIIKIYGITYEPLNEGIPNFEIIKQHLIIPDIQQRSTLLAEYIETFHLIYDWLVKLFFKRIHLI